MSEPNAFEVEMAIEKLKRHKSLDIDQVPAEFIKAGCMKFRSEIHKLDNSILNEEELPKQWNETILVPTHTNGDKTV
jgi:hypothetical protein